MGKTRKEHPGNCIAVYYSSWMVYRLVFSIPIINDITKLYKYNNKVKFYM